MKYLIIKLTFILLFVSSLHFQLENMRGVIYQQQESISQTDCTYTEYRTINGINYIYTFTCDGTLIGIDEVED